MPRGIPPALHSPEQLKQALAAIPSREAVAQWLEAWPRLDARAEGQAETLEARLLEMARQADRVGFRAAWVFAHLVVAGVTVQSAPLAACLDLWHGTDDDGVRREMMRALLVLPWDSETLQDLLEWAVNVVHLEDQKPATIHHALKVMERALASPVPHPNGLRSGDMVAMREALICIKQDGRNKPFVKKKAALLMARLPLTH